MADVGGQWCAAIGGRRRAAAGCDAYARRSAAAREGGAMEGGAMEGGAMEGGAMERVVAASGGGWTPRGPGSEVRAFIPFDPSL
jgi:hypothetical protein